MAGVVVSTVKDSPVFCLVTDNGSDVGVFGVIKIADLLEMEVVSMIIELSPIFRIPSPSDAAATSGVSIFIFLALISPVVLMLPFSAIVTLPLSISRP